MLRSMMPEELNGMAATILKNIGDGVITTDLKGTIIYLNPRAEEILHTSREKTIGKHFDDVFTLFDTDTKERVYSPVAYVLEQMAQTGLQNNTVLILEDQIEKFISTTCTPIYKTDNSIMGVVVVFRDITRLKQQEIHAKAARDYVVNILNQLPFAVWMADENFNWKYSNKATDLISDAAFHSNPVNSWLEFIHPEDVEKFWNDVNEALKKKRTFHLEARVRIKDVGFRWGLITGNPYYENGRYAGYIGSTFDITERKEAEEDLKRYQDLLIKAKETAETANKAKSEFLANMSHEIRTPINGIVGMIDLTLLTDIDEDQKDNLLTAKACANSLINIVNDVLDFSKMEAGKMSLEYINFDLKELIEEIIRTHSPRVFSKGLDLNYTFSSMIPRYLTGDPNRLRQVLNNLISNAVKFTERGEVSLVIKCTNNYGDEAELSFSVADTGIGIAKEDISKLFQSFSQIEKTYTKKYGGTGLGLVITKQLVEMMGGCIGIESEPGKGSNFYFTLKFKIGKATAEKKRLLPHIQKAMKPLHILLVEDDRVNQKVISKILLEKGHSVKTADHGLDAIESFHKEKFDVILMDIQMPLMNGIEAAHQIRLLEGKENHTPLIAMTAYALPGDREKFLSLGFDAYVSKPLQLEELFQVLEHSVSQPYNSMPQKVILTDNGEVIYRYENALPLRIADTTILRDLTEKIDQLSKEVLTGRTQNIEILANEIKTLCNLHEITGMKESAFKIELAARRGNDTEIVNSIERMKEVFKIYQNTNE